MRNVIITGGSRGLGLAMTCTLSSAGYRVIAVARALSAELTTASQAAATSGNGAIEFRACDLSDLNQIASLVRALRSEFGPIYGLINNAGLGTSGILANMRETEIQRLIQLNTVAPILLTKYVLKSMMSQREGRIVNIVSIVASTGYSGLSVYSATKASMLGFTRSLARELGPLGITVNAVAPGFVDTEMTRELTSAVRAQIERRSALKRMPDIADIANAVDFLFSDKARNITGTTTTVDAGNTA